MSAARNPFGGAQLAPHARFGRNGAAPANSHRRSLIAKVHVAKKELGLVDDDYRQILFAETGKRSAADCSEAELAKVLDRLKTQGFKPQQRAAARGGVRAADHPGAGKARALWISLGQLGAIDNTSEPALEAFARRQLKCDRLQWANQALVYRLIEALKAIAQRHGWDQQVEGIAPAGRVVVLKRRLIDAQMAKLRRADWMPADWDAPRAAFAFGGVRVASARGGASLTELDSIAQALARAIADARKAGAIT